MRFLPALPNIVLVNLGTHFKWIGLEQLVHHIFCDKSLIRNLEITVLMKTDFLLHVGFWVMSVFTVFLAVFITEEVAGWASGWCLSSGRPFPLPRLEPLQDWGAGSGQGLVVQHASTTTAHKSKKWKPQANSKWF